MKTTDVKVFKGKVNGQEARIIKSEIVNKDLGNILYVLGYEENNNMYIKATTVNPITEAKEYIKSGIIKRAGSLEAGISIDNVIVSAKVAVERVEKIEFIDELNYFLNRF